MSCIYNYIPQAPNILLSQLKPIAYKGYFTGFKLIYKIEHILVFMLELNRVINSMNSLVYHDTDNNCLFAFTRIGISHSFIVGYGYVVRLQGNNRLGHEDSTSIHVRVVEKMKNVFHQNNPPSVY